MLVTKYEQEFVRLRKYGRECVSTEAIMCKRFEDGLNEDIRLLVKILELNCKAKELGKEKRKDDFEARDLRKRSTNCPEMTQKDRPLNARPSITMNRGRPSRNAKNMSGSRGVTKDSVVRFEARAPARGYTIRAREETSSPDVITDTFSLYAINVIALIDTGSTYSYICVNLVSSRTLPVESTEFVIKLRKPLGKYVLVDKVCKNCPLMTRGYCFSADLMLLPFDEFDVILSID
ncbi:Gag-Pol polyprotein [Gossypium australe]|uniref:Gag-Pol polyprotein n=1 Tax=Gossypium australe TaxID=47621 RepID=A0A5B6VXQ8_9ROSI|nr:Gag-Pol polyprotein [Gossypium australe]